MSPLKATPARPGGSGTGATRPRGQHEIKNLPGGNATSRAIAQFLTVNKKPRRGDGVEVGAVLRRSRAGRTKVSLGGTRRVNSLRSMIHVPCPLRARAAHRSGWLTAARWMEAATRGRKACSPATTRTRERARIQAYAPPTIECQIGKCSNWPDEQHSGQHNDSGDLHRLLRDFLFQRRDGVAGQSLRLFIRQGLNSQSLPVGKAAGVY